MTEVATEVKPGKKSSGPRSIIEISVIVLIAILVAIIVRTFLLQLFYIPSASMDPYLKVNDKVFVNKMSYTFSDIERGDVLVFDAPDDIKTDKIKDLIKRVVGLPGETIEGRCKNGQDVCIVDIYIDGKKLEEPYLKSDIYYEHFTAITIPANSIFMMGDNRDDSEDGRVFGPIPISSVVGRAFFRLWPMSGFGFLS